MLFNSWEFLLFFVGVFILYWFAAKDNLKAQNILLLVASYFFYSWWDYRFTFLLMFSTFLDYISGIKIHEAASKRSAKTWLIISVVANLVFLGFFKYYNFFIGNFAAMLQSVGFQPNLWSLKIILPVGISFYTFHGLSYVFDIYNRKIEPTRSFINYSVFVSFFPLLVAGPIERATHLLPQVGRSRKFIYSNAVEGMLQILWGLFKKIVIADNCAELANQIFNNYHDYNGSTLILGAIFFAFQIYGDFSGYSDIALGTARILGFDLIRNFAFPYFSRDIAEFWRRWHISLSSWFRDYLYIPLGGNKVGRWLKVRNTIIIFLVSGFWHGANWTFIVWGALHAIYFLPLLLLGTNRNNLDIVAKGRLLPSVKEFFSMAVTFGLVVFAWIFFRATSVGDALDYISGIASLSVLQRPQVMSMSLTAFIVLLMTVEWMGREQPYALAGLGLRWPRLVRWSFYYLIAWVIILYGGKEQDFIYFQF